MGLDVIFDTIFIESVKSQMNNAQMRVTPEEIAEIALRMASVCTEVYAKDIGNTIEVLNRCGKTVHDEAMSHMSDA